MSATICTSSGTASASTCLGPIVWAPQDGATGVPTNTRLWSYDRMESILSGPDRLFGPEGEVLLTEGFFAVGTDSFHSVSTPEEQLQPHTLYRIETVYLPGQDLEYTESVSFTTGAGPSQAAPALPTILSRETVSTPEDGGHYWSALQVQFQNILLVDSYGGLGFTNSIEDLLVPEGTSYEDLDSLPRGPAVGWVLDSPELYVYLGDDDYDPCSVSPSSDGSKIRLGTMDLAGNFSGWMTETFEAPTPSEVPKNRISQLLFMGCSLSSYGPLTRGSAASGLWATVAIALLSLRRRQATTH